MHFKNVRLNEFREIAKDEMWKLKKQKQKKQKTKHPKCRIYGKNFRTREKMEKAKVIKLAETRTCTNITERYKTRKSSQIMEEVKKIKFTCRKKVQNKRQF